MIDFRYYSDQLGRYGYLMVTPSGRRIEFRQIGTGTTYETFDSSYLQLIDNGSELLVKTTDGTQMKYTSYNGKFRCSEIKDSNGNFITINYNAVGKITTIRDTLYREITFVYDGFGNLQKITQPWRRDIEGGSYVNETHEWATFGYAPVYIGYNFPGLTAVGPNGMNITMLSQVGLPDGSRFNFEYNSYGQVTTIRNYSSDSVQRSYPKYDLPSSSTDCPRISARRVWAHSWNGDTDGTPAANEEAVTSYSVTGNSTQVTLPDSTVYKEFYGSGWQSGLVTLAEWWTGSTRQKYVTTIWTQDNTGLTYEVNPRVTERNIYDEPANKLRRSTVDYVSFGLPSGTNCSLPSDVREFQANGTTLYRRTHTDYLTDSAYLNQRIIGLPSAIILYDASDVAQSRTLYRYDWPEHLEYIPGSINPPQHDGYYNNTSITTRGNLVSVQRISTDPNDPPNTNTEFKWGFNIAGSVTFTRDHIWHQNFFFYDDNFTDGVNRNTFAYPKKLRDGDWNDTIITYNYDMGVTARTQGPPPANDPPNPQGLIQTPFYDAAGRLLKELTVNNGAYTRFFYGPNFVQTYATIKDLANESYSYSGFDGLGRVIATASSFPGSTGGGGYRGVQAGYDNMGRKIKQSNPTETSAIGPNWTATDPNDGASGTNWLYTRQAYDWQGRPTITTNTDNSQKTIAYTGCGCAGGQVVTFTDETNRRERVTHDVLGRPWKAEVLKFDGNTYSTTTTTFDVRDQATLIRKFDGTDASTTYQDTLMTYDGYGRLKSRRRPEQTSPTLYSYWEDDEIKVITDARGATTTFGYNGRHQVTNLAYGGGYSAPSVTWEYDAAGNRKKMVDGMGEVTYKYDQLSRLTSEARYFTELNQSFTLSYGYNVGGQLTSIAEPSQFGSSVSYSYDLAGQLTGVTGSGSGSAPNYATGLQYRAWGALKHLNYGNSLTLDLTYNNRLNANQYALKTSSGSTVMGLQYQYDNTERLTSSTDALDSNLNRGYGFDNEGRLSSGGSGNGGSLSGPYQQTYNYDVWGNLTYRSWRTFITNQWGTFPVTNAFSHSYVNNRNTASGWQYDQDGRLLSSVEGSLTLNFTFDAAGRMLTVSNSTLSIAESYSGDGLKAKHTENGAQTFYVRSSVLDGKAVVELNHNGQKQRSYVYAGGEVLAKQENNEVIWDQRDPSDSSMRLTNSAGSVTSKVETDPLDTQVDTTPTYNYSGSTGYNYNPNGFYGNGGSHTNGCQSGGSPSACYSILTWRPVVLWWVNNEGRLDYRVMFLPHVSNPTYTSPPSGGTPTEQKPDGEACDERLKSIFGDKDAAFATDKDPDSARNARGRNRLLSTDEDPRRGHAHLYARPTGEGSLNSYAYTPPGFFSQSRYPYPRPFPTGGSELQNNRQFNYAPGSLQRYGYSGSLQINFIHTGPTDRRMKPLPVNHAPNDLGSVAVGVIGGFGNIVNGRLLDPGGAGQHGGDVHSHLRFYKLNIKRDKKGRIKSVERGEAIDPRKVFCGDLGFK